MGFLYVDGHVRAYHGQRAIASKAYVTRRHLAMPASTDYWINDRSGDPLLVITGEVDAALTKALPRLLREVRDVVGERRVTIVFDRGGWSPKLFSTMITDGFDLLTYRLNETAAPWKPPAPSYAISPVILRESAYKSAKRYVANAKFVRLPSGRIASYRPRQSHRRGHDAGYGPAVRRRCRCPSVRSIRSCYPLSGTQYAIAVRFDPLSINEPAVGAAANERAACARP